MAIGIAELLLVLLIGSAILGVVGMLRGRADALTWGLCAAIACCVAVGVWRYVRLRGVVAAQNQSMQADLERFLTPRPVRVKSADALAIDLVMRVRCDRLREGRLREICTNGGAPGDALRDDFIAGMQIGLWPAQRMIHADDAPPFRYAVKEGDAGLLTVTREPSGDGVLLRVRRAMARPAEDMRHVPPFLDLDSAEVRLSIAGDCAGGGCEMREVTVLAGTRAFCVEGLRRVSGDYRGKLRRCAGT